jgi:hypothetical protein
MLELGRAEQSCLLGVVKVEWLLSFRETWHVESGETSHVNETFRFARSDKTKFLGAVTDTPQSICVMDKL